jgi:Tfp pilus assembly protein PilO
LIIKINYFLKIKSKGGILEKTVQYLNDVKQTNQHLANHIQSLHQIRDEYEMLKQQVNNLFLIYIS